jgi:hypothetical protein
MVGGRQVLVGAGGPDSAESQVDETRDLIHSIERTQ